MTPELELAMVEQWIYKQYQISEKQFEEEKFNSEKGWGNEAQQNKYAFLRVLDYIEQIKKP